MLREMQYPTWLANPVMVKKEDGGWRICIDYTDFNKACPKDYYLLLKIDALVDSAIGNKVIYFLDASKGYHQIGMKW